MKILRHIFCAAFFAPIFLTHASAENIDAMRLRETLREATVVGESAARMKSEFESEKEALKARLEIFKELNARLEREIAAAKQSLESETAKCGEVSRRLKSHKMLEESLAEFLRAQNLSKYGDDAYACARDALAELRASIIECESVRVVKTAGGVRVLKIGKLCELRETDSAEVSHACDMLEGKRPYGAVKIRLEGRGAK